MHSQFWLDRWSEGRTGFHSEEVHPDLLQHEARLAATTPQRVLIPLCGKSVDLAWFASRGDEVVGLDLAPQAAEAVMGDAPAADLGPFRRQRRDRVTFLRGDLFAATPELIGTFDRVWDRAALVALDPPRRDRYATLIRRLLRPGGRILLNSFAYDASKMDGPPFSVEEAEVCRLYAGFHVERLGRDETLAGKFRERGLDWWVTTTWLLTAPG